MKITLTEGETDKLARYHSEKAHAEAAIRLAEAEHALARQRHTDVTSRYEAAIAALSDKYGRVLSVNFDNGEAEVEPPKERQPVGAFEELVKQDQDAAIERAVRGG
jgi:hypothetical protein